MNSIFSGTIYEPYDFISECTHDLVLHANPSPAESPKLSGTHLSKETMEQLSIETFAVFRRAIPDAVTLYRLPIEGFLIIAAGFQFPEALSATQEAQLMEDLTCWLDTALETTGQELGLVLQISVSGLHRHTNNVYNAYQEAFSIARHFPFFHQTSQIMRFREFQDGLTAAEIAEKESLEKQWLTAMEAHDFTDAETLLQKILLIRASKPITVTTLTQELISRMEFFSFRLCDTMELPLGLQERMLRQIKQIQSAKNMDAIQTEIHEIYAMLSSISDNSELKNAGWSKKISVFIQTNYANPDLNAALISRCFGLNAAYISHIFHSHTGIKLLDYIHTTRIDHIKHLLQHTNLKLSDIAIQTGYIDRYCMSRVFRRYVGQSPSEYRLAHKHPERP